MDTPPPPVPALAVTSTSSITSALGLGNISLTDLLVLSMLSNNPGTANVLGMLKPSAPAPTSSAQPSAPAPTSSAPSSPSNQSTFDINVPLDTFCTHYKLIDDDHAKLSQLGYKPGDSNIMKLGPDMWQSFAGFAPLAWNHIIDVHKRFLADIRRGTWAHLSNPAA